MANKRKTTTAIVAGVTAVALLLGGTFAWTSISQQAKNEAIVDINPGGRLHDDFNGTNKDVYVENFGDNITGVPIYARIRLDQYFEVGQEAGKNKDTAMADRNVEAKIGTEINDVTTWVTYKPGEDLSSPVQANTNWQWKLGNEADNMPYYMPTFNLNKDSLEADINGTYEGSVEGDNVHYDDYKVYSADSVETGTEIYDWDEDTKEENEELNNWDNGGITNDDTTPIDSADVYHKSTVTNEAGETVDLTHTAQPISTTAEVITMAQWMSTDTANGGKSGQPGPYWVYDTDGWAYWAQPIAPGETTGLLLDGINMSKVPDDNYYYGINVVGQFATAGDLSAFDKDGVSDDALELLGSISNQGVQLTINGDDSILIGKTATYTATLNQLGVELAEQPEITLSIENIVAPETETAALSDAGETGISIEGNTVTIADTAVAGTTFDIKADATVDETNYTAVKTVTVADWKIQIDNIEAGSLEKVTVDNLEWYVLAKNEEEGKALIWLADVVYREDKPDWGQNVAFGETNVWRDSNVRTWLNETFMTRLPILSGYIYDTEITTAAKPNRAADENGDVFITTTDKVFLLTEADVTGTIWDGVDPYYGTKTAATDPREYTLGKVGTIVTTEMCTIYGNRSSYTRSPDTYDNYIGCLGLSQGRPHVGYVRCGIEWTSFVRPAMWVSYTDEVISE